MGMGHKMLTNEELKRLLNVLRDDQSDIADAMLMALSLYTGMRKMEILGLKWSDIDFENGFILIREPKTDAKVCSFARSCIEEWV